MVLFFIVAWSRLYTPNHWYHLPALSLPLEISLMPAASQFLYIYIYIYTTTLYFITLKTLISTRLCSKKKWIEPTALNTGNPVYDFYEKWNFSSHPAANNNYYKVPGATRHGLSTAQLTLPAHTGRPISHALQKNLSHPCRLQFCLSICLGFLNFICTVIFSFHRYFGGEGWYCCPLEWCQGTNTGGKLSTGTITPSHIWPPPVMWEFPPFPWDLPSSATRAKSENRWMAATRPNSLSYIKKMYCNLSVNTAVFNKLSYEDPYIGSRPICWLMKGTKHRLKAMRAVWIQI